MPTWTGNILQMYKVYREERVRIRNSEIDCRMQMYDNLQYQSIVRFERIVSGRFSPLTRPPAPLHRIFSSPTPLPLIRFSGPLLSIFCSRSAHLSRFSRSRDLPLPLHRNFLSPAPALFPLILLLAYSAPFSSSSSSKFISDNKVHRK